MARISGVDIPREKRVVISLTYIFGIGPTRSREILKATKISEDIRVNLPNQMTKEHINEDLA